jgi:hypothetical protein
MAQTSRFMQERNKNAHTKYAQTQNTKPNHDHIRHSNDSQVSRFIQAAFACDENEIAEQLGDKGGIRRLTEIRNWPDGFATSASLRGLSFQKVIVPMLTLVTRDAIRLSTCETSWVVYVCHVCIQVRWC